MDDYSSSVAQMQTTTDPGEVSSESQATTLAGELERLRFLLKEITGEAQWYVTPTAGTSKLPKLGAANTFTDTQTIQSTNAGASEGPLFHLHRDSLSPAASDNLGAIRFQGESSTSVLRRYAAVRGQIIDPTDGSEDGQLRIQTIIAGAVADRFIFGAGFFTLNATGGDQGANTINASAIFDDGVQLVTVPQATQVAIEAETNEDTYLPPDLVKHSPGVAKVWASVDRSAGTPSLNSPSFNVASVTDDGAANTIVTIATDFSSAVYAAGASGLALNRTAELHTQVAGAFDVEVNATSDGTPQDTADFTCWAFGDHA